MDILDFCVTDDCVGLHFQVILGPYPSTLINPPIVEIAVNVMNLSGGGTTWYYNPPTFNMQAPFVGVNAIPAYDWEALITTNLTAPGANNGYIHPPGFGAAGIIPMNWVPNAAGPSVLSFTIPWGAPLAQPPIGTKVGYTVMAAHSGNGPLGTNSVPITDPDDVITNAGSGLPDNNSTANEFALDPLISLSTDYESTTTLSGCPMTTVSLTVAAQGVSENAGPALVSIQLSNPSPVDVTVSFTTNDGVAVQPGDYLTTFGQVTFTAGQVLKVIPVTLVNDNCIEPDEPFTFTISNPVNAYLGLALQTITIINDDSLPTIGVSVAAQSVAESVGNAIVEVDLSGSTCQNVTFDYTTSDVTAVQPADYTLISGSRTILAGDTRTTFAIPIVNDVLNELSEDFRFTISNIANATTGTATQTITILDDDPQPQVRLTAAAQSVNENAG
ncbi:hypothetical protein HY256_00790, partial [Candidatus Sumerlaeota bacterium]|nr:hypothetical protein [Candidatus Sumerlaeota bacterium]